MLLEDNGLIGDLQTTALVGPTGAVDWLCLPRFDSASCLSALLGDDRHGRLLVAPADQVRAIRGAIGPERRCLFERLGLANDLGLLAEEYDVAQRRQVGNFPQAFSHLTVIVAARAIAAAEATTDPTGAEQAG